MWLRQPLHKQKTDYIETACYVLKFSNFWDVVCFQAHILADIKWETA